MNLPAVQKFCGISGAMVNNLAVSQIQRADCLHIFIAQPEVPNIEVFLHALLVNRLRNNDNASLRIPPERDLRRRLSMLCADFRQNRMRENAMLSLRNVEQMKTDLLNAAQQNLTLRIAFCDPGVRWFTV